MIGQTISPALIEQIQEEPETIYWRLRLCARTAEEHTRWCASPLVIYGTEAEAMLFSTRFPGATGAYTERTTLAKALRYCKMNRRPAVHLKAYRHGGWITLHIWEVSEADPDA